MRLQQIDRSELESAACVQRHPWLAAVYDELVLVADLGTGRVLIAAEGGWTRAALGLELHITANDRQRYATLCVLAVDPAHDNRCIGSRLVRFAEGVAHVNGCDRVLVAPELDPWAGGRCWPAFGYEQPGRRFSKDISPRFRRSWA